MLRVEFSLAFIACALGGALFAQVSYAHINMDGPLQSRTNDSASAQKVGPCEGMPWGSGTVYKFEPGATITVGVDEYLAHDGYFRIAFDPSGNDAFVDPQSIDPINPNRYPGRKCEGTSADNCGESDFCSFVSTTDGPTVLWDNLEPHIPAGGVLGGGRKWSWTVKLPDVECERCTLQVMQIMEDPFGHGPFDGEDDLYYRCVDIVLERGAGDGTGTTDAEPENNGIDCTQAQVTDGGVVMLPDAGVTPIIHDAGTEPSEHAGHDEQDSDPSPDPSTPGMSDGGPRALTPDSSTSNGCSVQARGGASDGGWMLLMFAMGGVVWMSRRRKIAGCSGL